MTTEKTVTRRRYVAATRRHCSTCSVCVLGEVQVMHHMAGTWMHLAVLLTLPSVVDVCSGMRLP